MSAFLRTVVVAAALLTSGALQLAATMGEDVCCAGEESEAGEQDCPPGLACSCCPIRGALQFATPSLAPAPTTGVAVAHAALEPSLGASAADIFHPPRA